MCKLVFLCIFSIFYMSRISLSEALNYDDIIWDNMSDDALLKSVIEAEKQLKIFLYPIPQESIFPDLKERETIPHFQAE